MSENWSYGCPSFALLLIDGEIWSFEINRHISRTSASCSERI